MKAKFQQLEAAGLFFIPSFLLSSGHRQHSRHNFFNWGIWLLSSSRFKVDTNQWNVSWYLSCLWYICTYPSSSVHCLINLIISNPFVVVTMISTTSLPNFLKTFSSQFFQQRQRGELLLGRGTLSLLILGLLSSLTLGLLILGYIVIVDIGVLGYCHREM